MKNIAAKLVSASKKLASSRQLLIAGGTIIGMAVANAVYVAVKDGDGIIGETPEI